MTQYARARMRVGIVERSHTGHRLAYMNLLVSEALGRGDEVSIVVSPEVLSSPEFALHLADLPGAVHVLPSTDFSLAGLTEISLLFRLDLLVVPNGDRTVRELAVASWRGWGRISLLVMREHSQSGRIAVRAVGNCAKFATFLAASLRPKVNVSILKSSNWVGHSVFATALDPVSLKKNDSTEDVVRQKFGLTDEGFTFVVVGALTARKNIPLVIEAFCSADIPSSALIIAGELEDDIREHVTRMVNAAPSHHPIRLFDALLDDLELDTIVSSASCVVLAHSNNGPSGIFAKAIASGVFVLGAGAVSLRTDLKRIGQGKLWSPLDVERLAHNMVLVARESMPESTSTPVESSPDAFARVILR